MAVAVRLDIGAWRYETCTRRIRVVGQDLRGADVLMEIRLAPDTPGPPQIGLSKIATGVGDKIEVIGVEEDAAIVTSIVEITISGGTMANVNALPFSGEVGSNASFAYAIRFGGMTRLFGSFIALAAVIGADAAPAYRPPGGAGSTGAQSLWSSATVAFMGEEITLSLDGAEAFAPLIAKAGDAAERSEAAAASVTAQAVTIDRVAAAGVMADPREYELSGFLTSQATADGYLINGVAVTVMSDASDEPGAPYAPLPAIVGIGHSMVEQGITKAIAVALADPGRLGVELTSYNLGRSGLTSRAIAINFGGELARYRPVGGVIPAATDAVQLVPNDPGPLEAFGGAGGDTLGQLAGVTGTFTWAAGGPMTFARLAAGAAVGVPEPLPYRPIAHDRDALARYSAGQVKQRKVVDQAADMFAVLWAGRNDIFDLPTSTDLASALIGRYERIIARLRPRAKAFVILTELPTKTERDGNTASFAHVMAVNKAILRRWSRHAVDITTPFIAADSPSGSLTNDGYLHPNAQGQSLIAGVVADAIIARGLLTDVQI